MVEKDWVKILQVTELHKAEIIKYMLEEHGIPCVYFNKIDSSYLNFGEIEIFVKQQDAVQALHLINNRK